MICPFAIQRPGPPRKTNPGGRTGRGVVLHSAEGYEAGMFGVLDFDTVQTPDIRVSWHFSVMQDGSLFQHYNSMARCWHAHALGNEDYVGVEHEGVAGTPETDAQVEADVKLIKWLMEADGATVAKRLNGSGSVVVFPP